MALKTRIITVTGTKGKTSVVRILHSVLNKTEPEPVLGVDTHKIMLGSEKYATFTESRETSGLVPTVCPGRFLLSLKNTTQPVAILEAAVGCSQSPGLGYRVHEIGIFTNVYNDHIGVKDYLKSREDLAAAKSFVFAHIQRGGFAVFNVDEPLITAQLAKVQAGKEIKRIACTLKPRTYEADYVVTIENDAITIKDGIETIYSLPVTELPWLYGGRHQPSLYNGLFVVGGLWAFYKADIGMMRKAVQMLRQYVPDEKGGRMVVRTAGNGTKVIVDFAHESESLVQIADFARTHAPGGRVIGVVRLSGGRPNDHILTTTHAFASHFDKLVIYERNNFDDGLYKKFNRKSGDVAALMHLAASDKGVAHEVILDEKTALKHAYEKAGPDDAIVYIIGSSVGTYELAQEVFNFKEGDV